MPSSPPSLSSPTTPTSGSPTTRPLPSSSSFLNTLRELGCHQRNIHGSGSPTKSYAHMFCYTLSYIPMFIALGLMLGICGPYFYFFIYDYCYLVLYMSGHPYFLLYATSLAIFTVSGMLVAYFRSIFTNPGFVDAEVWQHPPRVLCLDGVVRESRLNSPNQNIVVAKFQGFTPRFCEKCKVYKPDRCHHCSECGKCVLNLDHHCPWICNCVGERNHKYFLLFLLYIGITGAHLGSSIVLAHWMYVGKVSLTASQGIAHFLISLCAGVFSFVMGLFGIFHIFLIASEETTIERNIARLTGKIPPQQKISWVTRCFTICTMKSFRQMIQPVMGDASPFWQWFLPCFSPKYHYSGSTVPGDKNAQIMRRVLGNDDDDEEHQHEMIVTNNNIKNNTTSMVV